jgi:hypothetical protein
MAVATGAKHLGVDATAVGAHEEPQLVGRVISRASRRTRRR